MEEVLTKIVLEAAYDYIDTCDKPSTFLRLMHGCAMGAIRQVSLLERICYAFEIVQVHGNGRYINGFKEEDFIFLYK